jgi:hypothetical protein
MLMPWVAKAGPIGGAGFAFPAWISSLITAFIFFAIISPLWWTI